MIRYCYTSDEMESLFRKKILDYPSPYSLDQLIKKMKELNQIDLDLKQKFTNQTIAVIGNSGKLLNEEYGKLIDSYDVVIRCNLARTHGYEKHVGTKTDFRIIAGKSFWRDLSENFSAYDENFLTTLKNEHFLIKAEPLYNAIQGIIKNYKAKSKISYIRQSVIDATELHMGISDISVGLTAIALALQWSSDVSIFGFNFYEEDWKQRHYFESIKPYQIGHNPESEKEYITKLIEQKIIKRY